MLDIFKSKISLLILFLVPLITACNSTAASDLTTDTNSTELTTETEQIEFLGRYVVFKSSVTETEFHIIYQDNSDGLVPGPSDWDIRVVMVVDDVAPWVEGKTAVETADFSWAEGLLTEGLRPSSSPRYYSNSTTTIAVYEPEQILYFYSNTLPH